VLSFPIVSSPFLLWEVLVNKNCIGTVPHGDISDRGIVFLLKRCCGRELSRNKSKGHKKIDKQKNT
jgi:hypothetical protein